MTEWRLRETLWCWRVAEKQTKMFCSSLPACPPPAYPKKLQHVLHPKMSLETPGFSACTCPLMLDGLSTLKGILTRALLRVLCADLQARSQTTLPARRLVGLVAPPSWPCPLRPCQTCTGSQAARCPSSGVEGWQQVRRQLAEVLRHHRRVLEFSGPACLCAQLSRRQTVEYTASPVPGSLTQQPAPCLPACRGGCVQEDPCWGQPGGVVHGLGLRRPRPHPQHQAAAGRVPGARRLQECVGGGRRRPQARQGRQLETQEELEQQLRQSCCCGSMGLFTDGRAIVYIQ